MTKALRVICLVLLAILLAVGGLTLYKINKPTEGENTSDPSTESTPDPENTAEPAPEQTSTPEPYGEADPVFTDVNSYLVVANKKHRLPEGYEPADLVNPNVETRNGDWQMRQEAAAAMENMFAAAAQDGVSLVLGSGYRSEELQAYLYNGYVADRGQEYADTISSRPGYSDHQTGLAADFCGNSDPSTDLSFSFENTVEGEWLRDHAHEYGFIMRYPKDKQDITGYAYEPWHFRYIGVDYATKIYNRDVFCSFEEYFGIEGGDYAD
ncbi:MAG: M15 family metallopeptidase [Solobacterium sp.]|nr:M15 family metallopeptidase [Solobacterium sp.]